MNPDYVDGTTPLYVGHLRARQNSNGQIWIRLTQSPTSTNGGAANSFNSAAENGLCLAFRLSSGTVYAWDLSPKFADDSVNRYEWSGINNLADGDDITNTVEQAIRNGGDTQMIMVDKNSSNINWANKTIVNPYSHEPPTIEITTTPQDIDGGGSITLEANVTADTTIHSDATISTYEWTASPNVGSFTDDSIEDAE